MSQVFCEINFCLFQHLFSDNLSIIVHFATFGRAISPKNEVSEQRLLL